MFEQQLLQQKQKMSEASISGQVETLQSFMESRLLGLDSRLTDNFLVAPYNFSDRVVIGDCMQNLLFEY